MKEKTFKTQFEERGKCPHCSKKLIFKKQRKVIEAAVPAEYEEKVRIDKDDQTTLKKA